MICVGVRLDEEVEMGIVCMEVPVVLGLGGIDDENDACSDK